MIGELVGHCLGETIDRRRVGPDAELNGTILVGSIGTANNTPGNRERGSRAVVRGGR